ncbi:CHAT domain-containing protein [Sporosarcina koreensis]|uniref:CHAT domain-containing protein n=1 Tax=Sporosarcina koreensis TaxID=334735 RepID=A0ABW0TXX4_9BACL
MAIIDTYRSNIARKRQDISKLSADRARETKKIPDLKKKIISANDAIKRTKSQSIVKSKFNEIARAEKALAEIDKKVASIDTKLAVKEREIASEEKKLSHEVDRTEKKKLSEEKRRLEETKRLMKSINETIDNHSKLHLETKRTLTELQNVPEKITVLFMASNPIGTGSLRLDEEARSINEMIRKAEHRDSVQFETRWAARPLDILQAINELNPDIIHFSGHGSPTDELVLQDADGSAKLISKEAIVQTMMTSSDRIRLVFFNTCFSFGQAEAVVQHVESAIGMNDSIGDEAARVFSAQFYSAIGFGLTLEKAFNQAKSALMLEGIKEENIPEIYLKEGLSANEIVLVKPAFANTESL